MNRIHHRGAMPLHLHHQPYGNMPHPHPHPAMHGGPMAVPHAMPMQMQMQHHPHLGPHHMQQQQHHQQQQQQMQDDFDGKRLRKSVMRKTVDYNSSVILALESRLWARDWRDCRPLQPDGMHCGMLLPPPSYPHNPINAVTTRFVKTATNKQRCPIFAVAWTPEGRRLVTGASSGEFTLWNGLTFNFETILQAHDGPVRSMVWSRGEAWMVTGDHGGYVKYWQTNMNNVKMFQAHREAVRGVAFGPGDSKIVTCSDDGTLRIFDFYRCQEERVLRGHGADVKCVQWHPTRALIVSGSKDNQQPVKLWDPKSGRALATLHAHKSTVMDLKWNENGNWLVTASRDHLLKLFDVRKLGRELQVFRGHKKEAASVAWHPHHEGLFCSGGSDGAILFWSVGAEKEVGCIEDAHESIVWTLAWHPLGHILCSGSNDHTSKFWTRNRPGDPMRDKYNLNTLPRAGSEERDREERERAAIPGMGIGLEDGLGSDARSDSTGAIPGLDLDAAALNLDPDRKGKKVPYSKPIPRNFQAQWNHGVDEGEMLAQALAESVPGVVPLQQIAPSAIIIYGKYVPVVPGSRLEAAIAEGPRALKRHIASGEIEEIQDVMPHVEDDDDEPPAARFIYATDPPPDLGPDRDPSADRGPNRDRDDRRDFPGDDRRRYDRDRSRDSGGYDDGRRPFERDGGFRNPGRRDGGDFDGNDSYSGEYDAPRRYGMNPNGGDRDRRRRSDERGDGFRGRGDRMWRGNRGRGRSSAPRSFRRPPRGNDPY